MAVVAVNFIFKILVAKIVYNIILVPFKSSYNRGYFFFIDVESNDATILHLNTTVHAETGMLTVTLHINKKEIAAIVSTFERYDYDVIYYFGNENFENEIHSNYRQDRKSVV